MTAAQIAALLVALQRLCELAYARRNARRLLDAGGIEHGAGQHALLVLLHAAWLASVFLLVPADAPIRWWLVAIYGLLQVARLWVIVSLGQYWTTRVITLPDAPLVRRGPYRRVRHPNYLIVVGEIAVLPLIFGAWQIALAFSLVNAILLAWRITVEEGALRPRRAL